MTKKTPNAASEAGLRLPSLSRWEDEAGATAHHLEDRAAAAAEPPDYPQLTNAELVQLRIRVIALENVVIALLTQADEACANRVHEMATYISPRAGFTHHPLTLHAAVQMESLVERSVHYQSMKAMPED